MCASCCYTFSNSQELWELFSEKLKHFIRSKVKDTNSVNDILQDIYIKIHQNVGNLKDGSKVQSWVFQIARNSVADFFRKSGNSNNHLADENDEGDISADAEIFEEAVRDMLSMMNKMPKEYCEALCLTELEGISQKEYAERIGISYSGAKSRVQRARIMLKDMLMDCCHYQFDKYGTVLSIQPKCCCCCPPKR